MMFSYYRYYTDHVLTPKPLALCPMFGTDPVTTVTIAVVKPVSYSYHDHPNHLRVVYARFPLRVRHRRCWQDV